MTFSLYKIEIAMKTYPNENNNKLEAGDYALFNWIK